MASNAAHVSLYVSRELREAIQRSAAENDRSLSAEVRVALCAYTSAPLGSAVSHLAGPSAPRGAEKPS